MSFNVSLTATYLCMSDSVRLCRGAEPAADLDAAAARSGGGLARGEAH
jgi:hypothetical protein